MATGKITDLTSLPTANRATNVLEVVDVSGNASYKATPNFILGLSGNPVGDTDSQTLTNKILTGPTISGPVLSGTVTGTYTLGGTPTFPAAVVTLTGSQTLTNKVLTSPTISSPTITNASITADAVTGFTTANNGTIYGVGVTAGVITTAAVGTSSIVTGAQFVQKTQNPYKFRARRTTAQNTGNAAFAIVNFATKDYDTGSNVDIVTNVGRFTAPIAGFYQFNWHVSVSGAATALITSLFKNGADYSRGTDIRGITSSNIGSSGSDIIQLAATDFVEINSFGNAAVAIDTSNTYFSGFLVSQT